MLIFLLLLTEQYVNCIWDKDTDKMVWWPPYIEECSRKYYFFFRTSFCFQTSMLLPVNQRSQIKVIKGNLSKHK